MTRVTDEMVEAGLAAIDHVHEGYALNYGEMRAALEAAASAAPATEQSFDGIREHARITISQTLGYLGFTTRNKQTMADAGEYMVQQLEQNGLGFVDTSAAPAVDTTEFEDALDTYTHDVALVEHHATRAVLAAASSLADGNDVGVRYDGTVKYWREQADAARQRLIDLFREAAR